MGLMPCFFTGLIKINNAIHHAMVGDGDGNPSPFPSPFHQRANAVGTVEKAVFRMNVQMNK